MTSFSKFWCCTILLGASCSSPEVMSPSKVNGPNAATDSPNLPAQRPAWNVVFIAHRGGIVPGYPENTLLAFRNAIAHGAQVLELDLRGTRDGRIVIMHDESVDRTTNGAGKVSAHTLAELRALDAGEGEKIPTFEEVLDLVAHGGPTLLLDIKQSPALDRHQVVRLIEEHRAELKVIVGARSVEDLQVFQALNPNLRTLGFVGSVEDIEAFVDAGVDIVRLWPDWIRADRQLIGRVHALGRPVWTTAGAARREELEHLIGLGVNGILSDLPQVMHSILDEMRENP